MNTPLHPEIIIGAGPAGLTAAYELTKNGHSPLVFESDTLPGGIARTEEYKGYRFDIGGHRFFTQVAEVENLWHEVLGDEFLKVPRLSRIFYQGKFFDYPLNLKTTLSNLGARESVLILLSYLRWKIAPYRQEENFEQWVTNRFGDRLYRTFFKTYTEKVWGISCTEIQAEWAAQRIRGLSLISTIRNAIFGGNKVKSLISEFDYPRLGPGQMWEHFTRKVEDGGGKVLFHHGVCELHHDNAQITSIVTQNNTGDKSTFTAENYISSMPITHLIHALRPAAPSDVIEAAKNLQYRALILVALMVKDDTLFPDNWIYVHTPKVQVGRIQNFKNWSADMVPEPDHSCLGMEYFCSENDALWNLNDTNLLQLAERELEELGLVKHSTVFDGKVVRQPKAYPVYDANYKKYLDVIRLYLTQFHNLQTIGRNGMHRYNNQDHSMLTGLLAARNILGENHDLWNVNTERSYQEEFVVNKK